MFSSGVPHLGTIWPSAASDSVKWGGITMCRGAEGRELRGSHSSYLFRWFAISRSQKESILSPEYAFTICGVEKKTSLTCLPTWRTIIVSRRRNGREGAVASRWLKMGRSVVLWPSLADKIGMKKNKKTIHLSCMRVAQFAYRFQLYSYRSSSPPSCEGSKARVTISIC